MYNRNSLEKKDTELWDKFHVSTFVSVNFPKNENDFYQRIIFLMVTSLYVMLFLRKFIQT